MRSCDEVPEEGTVDLPVDKECLETLLKTYEYESVLGAGANGVVLGVRDKSNRRLLLAIKLTPIYNAAFDVRVACKMNGLLDKSPIFNETLGWIVCNQVPHAWLHNNMYATMIQNWLTRGNKKLVYMVSIRNEYEFDQIWNDSVNRDPLTWKAGLFLLLHGIGMARKQFGGFSHGDIQRGNIMWAVNREPNKPIIVKMQNTEFHVYAPCVPKLIDFGASHFGKAQQYSYDLPNLYQQFLDYAPGADFKTFFYSNRLNAAMKWDCGTFDVDILLHDFFNPVRKVFHLEEREPVQKRLKIVEEPGGVASFIDEDTGQIVPEEALVTRYASVFAESVLRAKNAKHLLGVLERTSKTMRNFVRQHFLWYKLMERDFPAQCSDAAAQGGGKRPAKNYTMLQEYKDKLDALSIKPGRPYTYWKRYYELLSRKDLRFDRQLDSTTTADPYPKTELFVCREADDTFYIVVGAGSESSGAALRVTTRGGKVVLEKAYYNNLRPNDWYLLVAEEDVSWISQDGFQKVVVSRSAWGTPTIQFKLYAPYDDTKGERRQLVSENFYQ